MRIGTGARALGVLRQAAVAHQTASQDVGLRESVEALARSRTGWACVLARGASCRQAEAAACAALLPVARWPTQ